ncbi:MAG: hypothetical protein UU47_C0006G0021 [candidate division TM6 bacterium GW2011_GWE2_41_16]|nr:MAG: hypothetical protein UU47_C0006G0021 [candidate division TM6 bacterium GW2011_GWE2_41_16]
MLLCACVCTANVSALQQDSIKVVRQHDKLPVRMSYTISPDGKNCAFLTTGSPKDVWNIFVHKVGSSRGKQVTFEKNRHIKECFWLDNSTILYFAKNRQRSSKEYGDYLCAFDLHTMKSRDLMPISEDVPFGLSVIEGCDQEIFIQQGKHRSAIVDAYRLNAKTGVLTCVAQYKYSERVKWIADHNGKKVRAALTFHGQLLYRNSEQDDFKEVVLPASMHIQNCFMFTFDNKNLILSVQTPDGGSAVCVLDPQTGSIIDTIMKTTFAHAYHAVDFLDNVSLQQVALAEYSDASGKKRQVFFDSALQTVYENLHTIFEDAPFYMRSVSDDLTKIIFSVIGSQGVNSEGAYFLYDKQTNTLTKLAAWWPSIETNGCI